MQYKAFMYIIGGVLVGIFYVDSHAFITTFILIDFTTEASIQLFLECKHSFQRPNFDRIVHK